MACDNMQKSMAHCENIRDSGVEWLGEIPAHWNVTRIKYAAQLSPACDIKKLNSDAMITFTPMECIHDGYFDNKSVPLSYIKGTYTPYAEGDIVLAKVTPCFENGNISVMEELASGYGLGSSELFVLRPYAVNKWYLFYYLRNEQFIQRACASMTGTGGLKRIPGTFIQNYPLLLPSPEEQEAISKYLNDKCAQINSLISEIESTIKEYVSWKSSIIYEAVTKGLNPNVEMKDSGITWIGKIPARWGVGRVKNCFINHDEWREPVSAENRENKLKLYDYYGASGAIDKIDFFNVDDTVLLIGEDGANLRMRNLPLVYKASGKFWVNNHAHILKVKEPNSYDFMAYLLEAGDYNEYITGSAQPKLSQFNLMRYPIPLVPPREQKEIETYLNRRCSKIDEIIEEKKALISDLESYKKSLIFEVVTGKRRIIS